MIFRLFLIGGIRPSSLAQMERVAPYGLVPGMTLDAVAPSVEDLFI